MNQAAQIFRPACYSTYSVHAFSTGASFPAQKSRHGLGAAVPPGDGMGRTAFFRSLNAKRPLSDFRHTIKPYGIITYRLSILLYVPDDFRYNQRCELDGKNDCTPAALSGLLSLFIAKS